MSCEHKAAIELLGQLLDRDAHEPPYPSPHDYVNYDHYVNYAPGAHRSQYPTSSGVARKGGLASMGIGATVLPHTTAEYGEVQMEAPAAVAAAAVARSAMASACASTIHTPAHTSSPVGASVLSSVAAADAQGLGPAPATPAVAPPAVAPALRPVSVPTSCFDGNVVLNVDRSPEMIPRAGPPAAESARAHRVSPGCGPPAAETARAHRSSPVGAAGVDSARVAGGDGGAASVGGSLNEGSFTRAAVNVNAADERGAAPRGAGSAGSGGGVERGERGVHRMDNRLCMRAYLQLGSWQLQMGQQASGGLDDATITKVHHVLRQIPRD